MGLGKVRLDDGAFHFMRRLAGRDMGDQIGIEEFHVIDPARGARGDLGKDTIAFDAVKKFGRFFHDGEVGAEVGVKDTVESKTVERSNHLAGAVFFANAMSEFFGDGGTDGGSGLDNHFLASGDRGIDLIDFAMFGKGAGGADFNTLTALETGDIGKGFVLGGTNDGTEATFFKA